MLSKAMLVGTYRRKAELIAKEGDIALTVAVPSEWRDQGHVRRLESGFAHGYRLVDTPIALPGHFHVHFHPHLGRLLDDARPELVHVDEEPYNLATFLAMAQARRRGARTLFFTWQNLRRRYPPPFALFEAWALRAADGAIAGSHTAADVLRAKGYRGPLWTLPQVGVDTHLYAPGTEPAPGRPFTIGFAGRLVAPKGLDLLFEAAAALSVGFVVSVIGTGEARGMLESRAAELGIAERVVWSDWRPSVDMPAYYRSLDVLVLPSRSTRSWIEQFGRVLIEAMACEVACVGSSSGEIPHVLGDAGLVFPEGDAGALRECLQRLAHDDALRAHFAQAGRERVLELFDMERVAAETAAVYRRLARSAGRPASAGADSGCPNGTI